MSTDSFLGRLWKLLGFVEAETVSPIRERSQSISEIDEKRIEQSSASYRFSTPFANPRPTGSTINARQSKSRERYSDYGLNEPGSYESDVDDMAFEIAMEQLVPPELTDKRFHVKIAGASHQNLDGTHRRAAISKCLPLEKLSLVSEPDNPYDSNAIGVWTARKRQIGYLDSRLAQEISGQRARWNARWEAYFCRPTINFETGKVAGCVMFLVRYKNSQ